MAVVGSKLTLIGSKTEAEINALTESISGALYFPSDSTDIYVGTGGVPKKHSGIISTPSRPQDPVENQVYWIGTAGNYILEAYINQAWETIISGGSGSGNIDGGRADEVYQQDDIIDGGGA